MFFPVYNDRSDLLVHENQDGDQQRWDSGSQVHPPGISSKRGDKPASIRTCWLRAERQHFSEQNQVNVCVLLDENQCMYPYTYFYLAGDNTETAIGWRKSIHQKSPQRMLFLR